VNIGEAVEAMKAGSRVHRPGWNGAGVWLSLTPGMPVRAANFWSENNKAFAEDHGGVAVVRSYVTMKTADNEIVPWVCSQSDLLATDWAVLP